MLIYDYTIQMKKETKDVKREEKVEELPPMEPIKEEPKSESEPTPPPSPTPTPPKEESEPKFA